MPLAPRLPILIPLLVWTVSCRTTVPPESRPPLALKTMTVSAESAPPDVDESFMRLFTERLLDTERFTLLPGAEEPRQSEETNGVRERAPAEIELDLLTCQIRPVPQRFPAWLTPPGAREARVALHLRAVNTRNGQAFVSERIERTQRVRERRGEARTDVSTRRAEAAALERALEGLANDAVAALEHRIQPDPWTPRVIAVEGDRLRINGGADRGVRVGDRFQLFRAAQDLRDPQSDRLLGVQVREPMGTVAVAEVGATSALCRIPAGWQVERGMVLRPVELHQPWWQRLLR